MGQGLCAFAAVLDAREKYRRARPVDYSRDAVEGIFEIITEFYYWWKAKMILAGERHPRELLMKARRKKRQRLSDIRQALEKDYKKLECFADTWLTWKNRPVIKTLTGQNLIRHILRD